MARGYSSEELVICQIEPIEGVESFGMGICWSDEGGSDSRREGGAARMPLFIDRLPLHSWTDNTPDAAPAPTGLSPSRCSSPTQDWHRPLACPSSSGFFDPGSFGEAFAWRSHLLSEGLDPDQNRAPFSIVVTSSMGGRLQAPVRRADLWLVSNVAEFQNAPYRVPLERGIPFRNVPTLPDPSSTGR